MLLLANSTSIACSRFAPDDSPQSDRSPTRSSRRITITALDPVREITPAEEESPNVSFLNHIGLSAANDSGALVASPIRSIRDLVPKPDTMLSVVKRREEIVFQQGADMLLTLRAFLSNSRNIWSLTALFELLYILYAVIPWAHLQVCYLSPLNVHRLIIF